MALNVVARPLTELSVHPDNPRTGSIDVIKDSLEAHGQYRPIVTTTDGTILAGNHTFQAATTLGWQEMDCVVLDIDPLSDKAKRIMLVDNRSSDISRYDETTLRELLQSLDDLSGTGYEIGYLRALDVRLDDTPQDSDFTGKEIDLETFETTLVNQCPRCKFQY